MISRRTNENIENIVGVLSNILFISFSFKNWIKRQRSPRGKSEKRFKMDYFK